MWASTDRARRTLLAGLIALGAAGCGGGGGGGADGGETPAAASAAPLTPDNYVTASTVAVSTSLSVLGPLEVLMGTQVNGGDRLLRIAVSKAASWPTRARAQETLVGATFTEVESCDGGGTVTYEYTVANENSTTVGDSARIRFAGCRFFAGDDAIDGLLQARVDSLSGNIDTSYVYGVALSVTMENLSLRGSGSNYSGNGTLTLAIDSFNERRRNVRITVSSLSVVGDVAGRSYSRRASNLTLDLRSADNSDLQLRVDGRIEASELGGAYIDIETQTPFFEPWNRAYPTAGVLVFRGANASRARVTAQSDGRALIELDANGDGTYESSTTRSWSELSGG